MLIKVKTTELKDTDIVIDSKVTIKFPREDQAEDFIIKILKEKDII